MAIASGRLRHQMELQEQVQAQDATTGVTTVTWSTVATVWAAIEPLSAREFVESAANQSQVSARVTIRYRAGVTAAMRLAHMVDGVAGRIYNIEGVLADKDSGMEYLTLPVSEGVNDGQ
jgi:SPP1 family predicted phage head-tail adaptor